MSKKKFKRDRVQVVGIPGRYLLVGDAIYEPRELIDPLKALGYEFEMAPNTEIEQNA